MDVDHLLDLYQRNKLSAANRGISYELTFKAWLYVWGERIYSKRRGQGSSKFRLERIDKARGYCVGNVHVVRKAGKK